MTPLTGFPVFNEDGSTKDPQAFREALRADPDKLKAIQDDAEVAGVVLGEDDGALQKLLRDLYQVRPPPTSHALNRWTMWM